MATAPESAGFGPGVPNGVPNRIERWRGNFDRQMASGDLDGETGVSADDAQDGAFFRCLLGRLGELVVDDPDVAFRRRHRGVPGETLRDGRRAKLRDTGNVGRPQIVE